MMRHYGETDFCFFWRHNVKVGRILGLLNLSAMNLYGRFSLISADNCAIWAAGGLGTPGLWWEEWDSAQPIQEGSREGQGMETGESFIQMAGALLLWHQTTDFQAERILNH